MEEIDVRMFLEMKAEVAWGQRLAGGEALKQKWGHLQKKQVFLIGNYCLKDRRKTVFLVSYDQMYQLSHSVEIKVHQPKKGAEA